MDDDLNLSPIELAVLSLTVFVVFSLLIQEFIPANPEMEKLQRQVASLKTKVREQEGTIKVRNLTIKRLKSRIDG